MAGKRIKQAPGGSLFINKIPVLAITLLAAGLAVSYLSGRPEVDARRIGAMGYSMGSFVLSLTGAVERRLRACVLVGEGNLDGPGEYREAPAPWGPSCPDYPGRP